MKKNFTHKTQLLIIAAVFSWYCANSQAITIEAADMPVPTVNYNYDNIIGMAPSVPTIAQDAQWDYSTYFGNMPDFAAYHPETITLFTDAGVDVYRGMFKYFNTSFGYQMWQEFDFNENVIDDIAVDVPYQPNTLQPFTGNISDSIFILPQSYILNQPRRIVEFPFTANSSWNSNSRRVTEMILNVPSFGLNNAPVTHAYTWVRKDTIIAYGKMRVYTSAGPSIEYDVLLDKSSEYTLDSFYLAGQPAPSALLTAFGVSQGQKTNVNYRYQFYRKGTFAHLLGYFYGADESFTNPVDIYVHTDDIETYNGTFQVDYINYTTVLYPNPSIGNEINIKILGQVPSINKYTISDIFGKTIQTGSLENGGMGEFNIPFQQSLIPGNYFISLQNNAQNILTEYFQVTEK